MIAAYSLVLLLNAGLAVCRPQLINSGARGVITLAEGFQYRDQETMDASGSVAAFARHFQAQADIVAEQRRQASDIRGESLKTPRFSTSKTGFPVGTPMADSQIFGYSDSRYLQIPAESRVNYPEPEVERERQNLRSRSGGAAAVPSFAAGSSLSALPLAQNVAGSPAAVPLRQPAASLPANVQRIGGGQRFVPTGPVAAVSPAPQLTINVPVAGIPQIQDGGSFTSVIQFTTIQ